MKERAYTVAEIDALRIATRRHIDRDWLPWQKGETSRVVTCASDSKIEEQVRTYMLAGIVADDLLAEDRAERARIIAQNPDLYQPT